MHPLSTSHYVIQEMFESALANFDVVVKLQADFTAHVWRGATLKQLSRYDKAILDFDRAIALESNAAYPLPVFYFMYSLFDSIHLRV